MMKDREDPETLSVVGFNFDESLLLGGANKSKVAKCCESAVKMCWDAIFCLDLH